jgi:hypothetical protein
MFIYAPLLPAPCWRAGARLCSDVFRAEGDKRLNYAVRDEIARDVGGEPRPCTYIAQCSSSRPGLVLQRLSALAESAAFTGIVVAGDGSMATSLANAYAFQGHGHGLTISCTKFVTYNGYQHL